MIGGEDTANRCRNKSYKEVGMDAVCEDVRAGGLCRIESGCVGGKDEEEGRG